MPKCSRIFGTYSASWRPTSARPRSNRQARQVLAESEITLDWSRSSIEPGFGTSAKIPFVSTGAERRREKPKEKEGGTRGKREVETRWQDEAEFVPCSLPCSFRLACQRSTNQIKSSTRAARHKLAYARRIRCLNNFPRDSPETRLIYRVAQSATEGEQRKNKLIAFKYTLFLGKLKFLQEFMNLIDFRLKKERMIFRILLYLWK